MSDFLSKLYARVRYQVLPSVNPVMYVAIALALVITAVKVYQGTPLTEVLTEDYWEQVMVLVGGIITRFTVYAPATVQADTNLYEHHETAAPDDGE